MDDSVRECRQSGRQSNTEIDWAPAQFTLRKDNVDTLALTEAARNYLRLGSELEQSEAESILKHIHSKLGIFIECAIGTQVWRQAIERATENQE